MSSEKSVGAIIFLRGKEIKYLLLHYESGHWDYVKGHIEKGESEKETLLREAKEEAGLTDLKIIDGFKERIRYFFKAEGKLISKEVVFYLAETKTEDIKLSFEHKGFKWLPYADAEKIVTYKNAKELLKKADEFLKKKKSLRDF
ncbi:MAG TPA: NUDIX domain-containing protein [archaeon]|nr:NUDIX domain-containing protein [archaeon]